MLQDFRAAWNDYDSEAVLALLAEENIVEAARGPTSAERAAVASADNEYLDAHVEKVGDSIVFGDGEVYKIQSHGFAGRLE